MLSPLSAPGARAFEDAAGRVTGVVHSSRVSRMPPAQAVKGGSGSR